MKSTLHDQISALVALDAASCYSANPFPCSRIVLVYGADGEVFEVDWLSPPTVGLTRRSVLGLCGIFASSCTCSKLGVRVALGNFISMRLSVAGAVSLFWTVLRGKCGSYLSRLINIRIRFYHPECLLRISFLKL